MYYTFLFAFRQLFIFFRNLCLLIRATWGEDMNWILILAFLAVVATGVSTNTTLARVSCIVIVVRHR